MILKNLISRNKKRRMSLYTKSVTYDSEGMASEPTWTLLKTIDCLFWLTAGHKTNISDRFKDVVHASAIVSPDYISISEFATEMKITIDGYGDYKLIYADNIGSQNKIIQVNMGNWK